MTEQSKKRRVVAQGDLLLIETDDPIPEGVVEAKRQDGKLVVAHSETGHHHVILDPDARMFDMPDDPLVSFLELPNLTDLVHERSFDTHKTIQLRPVRHLLKRQRENSPYGPRRVED